MSRINTNVARTSVTTTVRGIAKDAQKLIKAFKPKAESDIKLTHEDYENLRRLTQRAQEAASQANQQAKQRCENQILELEQLLANLDQALGTPGLDNDTRSDLKRMRRQKRAQLLRLQTKLAMDFAGILSARDIQEIQRVIKKANKDVKHKRRAAAILATLVQITDIAIRIAKVAAAV